MTFHPSRRWLLLALPVVVIAAVIMLWQWDWFIPLLNARASAAIGREVTVGHLHVSLGRVTRVVTDDVKIANPPGFAEAAPFAAIAHVGVAIDVEAYLRRRAVVIPEINVDQPEIHATQDAAGANNYTFHFTGADTPSTGPGPEIGALTIVDGRAQVLIPKLQTDATATIATRAAPDQADPKLGAAPGQQKMQIVVEAKGTYAGQPVTGKLIGGALLSLRDQATPYPIDLDLANGPTRVTLVGTVQNPVAFAGADLKLSLAGPDMGLLFPLTGIPLPKTPPYKVSGQLDYADRKIRFHGMNGQVGKTDLEGDIDVDPKKERQDVVATLHSRNVDLEDLGGFIGSEPGRSSDPNMSAQQKRAVAKAEASTTLLPNTPINLPRLRAADIHMHYKGDHIVGRNVPFDRIEVAADVVNGAITLHPMTLGVGTGQIKAEFALTPQADDVIHAKGDVQVQRLDVSRMLEATHAVNGAGRLGGSASIDTTGNSLAAMLAAGNGKLDLYMSGGNLSALLVDLAGLEFGNAVLSAIGIPTRADLRCLIGQFTLQRGVLQTRTLVVDTSEAVITGQGSIDLGREQVHYVLTTEAKHFTIGSLPAPIGISGKFKHTSISPDLAALGLRGGVAVGLGFVFPPLALLPTIQLGVGDDNRCSTILGKK